MDLILHTPICEIVYTGDNEWDKDDFHPNKELQIIANHIGVAFPICYLYLMFYDGPAKARRYKYLYESEFLGNQSLIVIDLKVEDPTDQNETIKIGFRCHHKYYKKVKERLMRFVEETNSNSSSPTKLASLVEIESSRLFSV